MRQQKTVEPLPLLISSSDAARLLGVSTHSLKRYRAGGLPVVSRGQYDPVAIVQWYARNEASKLVKIEQQKKAGSNISDERKLTRARTEKLEIENATKRHELLHFEEVAGLFLFLVTMVTNAFESLAPRLANIVASIDNPAEVEAEIFREARDLRRRMAEEIRQADLGLEELASEQDS